MLTQSELAVFESVLLRARGRAGLERAAALDAVRVGDVLQLRPGADSHWETSLVLVEKLRDDGRISGTVLRPHRSGCREAWYTFTPPEILRIGGSPFPPPCRAIRDQSYLAWCPKCMARE